MRNASITAALLTALACMSGTGGEIVDIELALGGDTAESFETSMGWTVTLEEARVALGPVYAFAPRDEPIAQLRLLPVARAHGGFDPLDGRKVRTELLEQTIVDALDPSLVAMTLPAESGPVTELRVVLLPAAAGDVAPLQSHQALMRGVARRDDTEVEFEGAIDLPEDQREVGNIDAVGTVAAGARLELRVDAAHWVDGIDFSRLAPSGEINEGSQAYGAWRVGLRSPSAFEANWKRGDGR